MGDERAETYLRVLAEAELRRAGEQIRLVDAMAGTDAWSPQGSSLFGVTERAQWKVGRTARILVAAGVLDQECLDDATGVLSAAIQVRSRLMLNWYRSRGVLHRTIFGPAVVPVAASPGRPGHAGHAHRADARGGQRPAPYGASHVPGGDRDRGPDHRRHAYALAPGRFEPRPGGHRGRTHHLPYDQFWGVDDEGTRYTARFEAGYGEAAAWRGVIQFSPVPPRRARWLDLTGDGTPLVRLSLRPDAARPRRRPPSPRRSRPPTTCSRWKPNASWPPATPQDQPRAPTRARSSPCSPTSARSPPGTRSRSARRAVPATRRGRARHHRPAGRGHPGRLGQRRRAPGRAGPGRRPQLFAPLAAVLPDADGAWFAVAGLSSAAGESHLHVVCIGLPRSRTGSRTTGRRASPVAYRRRRELARGDGR